MAGFFSYAQFLTISYISPNFPSLLNPMRNFFSYTFPFRLDIPTL